MSLLAPVLIALAAPLVIGLGIWRPTRTIIPLYAALVPIGGVLEIPVPLPAPFNSLSSLVGGFVILAIVLHILLYGQGRIPSLPVAAWFIFLSWITMTAFWALQPAAVVEDLRLALPLVLLMTMVGVLPSEENDVGAVRVAIVVGGAVIGVYALALLLTGSSLPIHGTAQRFSIVSDPSRTNPNQLAAALILPLIFSLDLVLWGRGPYVGAATWKLVGAGSALVIGLALILTGSRGGVIAAIMALLVLLALTWRWLADGRRAVIRFVVGTFLTVVLLAFVSFVAVKLSPQGRLAEVASIDPVERLTSYEAGTSGRSDIWTTGLAACRQYCALGAGFGNFPTVFTDLFATSGAERNVGLDRPGHNLYIQIAVETGFVGLALLGLAFACEWMALRSAGTLAPALAAGLVALLVVDAFESFIWFKYFWLLFMVIRLAERASPPREPASGRLTRVIGSRQEGLVRL